MTDHREPRSQRCAHCRAWRRLEPGYSPADLDLGDCRLEPPRFEPVIYQRQTAAPTDRERDVYEATRFPTTEADDWCARFEWTPSMEPITV